MGLRLEVYNENFVSLIADFTYVNNSKEFYSSDSVEEAIKYFDLYLDPKTNHLKRNDPNQKIVDKLAIDSDNIDEFQDQLQSIIDKISDEEAEEFNLLFENWNSTKQYQINDRVRYEGVLYKCLQAHTAQLDWTPDVAVSLWAKLLIDPIETGPQEWVQPDSTNPYMDGDRVSHNGFTWESQIDNNVWEPGVSGTESLWVKVE